MARHTLDEITQLGARSLSALQKAGWRPKRTIKFAFWDAEEFGLGEHEAGVNDDDVVAEAEGEAVHAEFAQTAERNDLQFC